METQNGGSAGEPLCGGDVDDPYRNTPLPLPLCVILPNLVVRPIVQKVPALLSRSAWTFDPSCWHVSRLSKSLKVIGTDTDRSATWLPMNNIITIYLSVSEINGDFSRKSQNFLTPVYLTPQWRGSPCIWVSALRVKNTQVTGLSGRERSLAIIFSRLDTMHERDGWTDGRTQGDSKESAYG